MSEGNEQGFQRQAPDYGEYATPEEQAEASGVPWAPPSVENRVDLDAPPVAGPRVAPQYDAFATLILLAVGLFTVFSDVKTGLALPAALDSVFSAYGIGTTFHGTSWTPILGYAIVAVSIAGFGIAVYVSVRRLRAGRLAFWVPLVAGVVVGIVTGILCLVAATTDPSFGAFLAQLSSVPTPTATP